MVDSFASSPRPYAQSPIKHHHKHVNVHVIVDDDDYIPDPCYDSSNNGRNRDTGCQDKAQSNDNQQQEQQQPSTKNEDAWQKCLHSNDTDCWNNISATMTPTTMTIHSPTSTMDTTTPAVENTQKVSSTSSDSNNDTGGDADGTVTSQGQEARWQKCMHAADPNACFEALYQSQPSVVSTTTATRKPPTVPTATTAAAAAALTSTLTASQQTHLTTAPPPPPPTTTATNDSPIISSVPTTTATSRSPTTTLDKISTTMEPRASEGTAVDWKTCVHATDPSACYKSLYHHVSPTFPAPTAAPLGATVPFGPSLVPSSGPSVETTTTITTTQVDWTAFAHKLQADLEECMQHEACWKTGFATPAVVPP